MNRKKLITAVVLAICFFIIFFNQNLLFLNPLANTVFENIVYAAKDNTGNLLVLDKSGKRLIKADEKGIEQWKVQSSDNGFSEAKRAVSAENGNIYVQDIKKEENGYRISQERIIEYSQNGEWIRNAVVYEYENPVLTQQIIGIVPTENGVNYFYKQENCLEQYDQNQELLKSYSLPQAKQFVAGVAYDEALQQLYYSNYRGEVYCYIDGKKDKLLYTAENAEELSIPKAISIDSEQNLYAADIGLRDILKIDLDGNVERIEEKTDYYDKKIAYCVNADYGLVASTNYSVKLLENGEYTYITSFTISNAQKIMTVIVWAAVIVVFVAVCRILLLGLYYVLKSENKFIKIAGAMIAGVLVLSVVFMGILIPEYENNIIETMFERAQMASDITEQKLPIEDFMQIDCANDFMGENYRAVRDTINGIFLSGDDSIYDLYCTLYRIQDNMIVSTYCLQEDTGAIYPYDWYYEGSDEQEIIESKIGKRYTSQSSEGSYLFVLNPIIDETTGEAVGLIEVGTDLNTFQKMLKSMIFDLMITMVAITIVFILVAIELIFFFQAKGEYERCPQKGIPVNILRTIVFGIFFLTNMATGFLPLYALELAQTGETFGIPQEIMASIPISAEVVTGALFSVFGNKVIEKLGQKKAVLLSGMVFCVGFTFRIVPNIWVLTLGNAIVGIGWGVLLLVINTMIAMKPEDEKDSGFAAYSSAALNGVNCGVVIGGFLMNWLSHEWILILAAILSVCVLFLVRKYLCLEETQQVKEVETAQTGQTSVWKFLLKRRILTYFVMIVIPVIACGYFLNYMFPILAADYGMSETNIGYAYLLNGLCVMCLSNVLTNVLGTKLKKKNALAAASCIYAAAFLMVGFFQNIPSLLVALILLGISDSFGLPMQTDYYTDLEETKQFGYDRAIGIYSLFENGAQAAGSFVFSYVLLIGVRQGLWVLGGILVCLALIFLLLSLGKKSGSKK